VLIFCTGADAIPLGGFDKKIKMVFLNDDKILPTSSTCSPELRIPTCHRTNEEFNEKMILAFKGSPYFGEV